MRSWPLSLAAAADGEPVSAGTTGEDGTLTLEGWTRLVPCDGGHGAGSLRGGRRTRVHCGGRGHGSGSQGQRGAAGPPIFNRQNVTLNIPKALDYGALTAHSSATPEARDI